MLGPYSYEVCAGCLMNPTLADATADSPAAGLRSSKTTLSDDGRASVGARGEARSSRARESSNGELPSNAVTWMMA